MSNSSAPSSDMPASNLAKNGQQQIKCVICSCLFERKDLEGHISSDHLDYYPYSCGHCGHFMPTEELVNFHADRKSHLPVKIRENLNKHKESQLQDIMKKCLSAPSERTDHQQASPNLIPKDDKNELADNVNKSESTYSNNIFAAFGPTVDENSSTEVASTKPDSYSFPDVIPVVVNLENAKAAVSTTVANPDEIGKVPISKHQLMPIQSEAVKKVDMPTPAELVPSENSTRPAAVVKSECKLQLSPAGEKPAACAPVPQVKKVDMPTPAELVPSENSTRPAAVVKSECKLQLSPAGEKPAVCAPVPQPVEEIVADDQKVVENAAAEEPNLEPVAIGCEERGSPELKCELPAPSAAVATQDIQAVVETNSSLGTTSTFLREYKV